MSLLPRPASWSSLEAEPAGGQRTAFCQSCQHWSSPAQALEQAIPGLRSLGSAYAATAGHSRLCRRLDCWVSPDDWCVGYVAAQSVTA